MIEQGFKTFAKKSDVDQSNSIVLTEISLNDPFGNDLNVPEEDLVVRIKLLNALGYSVMVSDYTRYFSLRAYFRQYTNHQIGIVLGMINVREIFDEDRYAGVEGGILEGFGKLFPDNTRLYVYPERDNELLSIYSRDVLKAIAQGNQWQDAVPEIVASEIVENQLLGYRSR